MASALFYTAQLDPSTLQELQNLESELGVTLVAMQPDSSQEPAELSDDQLERIRAMEDKSGKVLLAFR